MTRAQEREASKFFGKYVTKEKAILLIIVTTLVCLMPSLNGIRLWNQIPEIVETGLIGANGEDDSLPRAVLVFGLAGLMVILNLICHGQLWFNQKAQKLAPQASRLVGRWGFPVLSTFAVSIYIINCAGEKPGVTFWLPCIAAMLMMFYASHAFDDAQKDFRVPAICWMAAAVFLLFMVMYTGTLPLWTAAVLVALIVLPIVYVRVKKR